MLYREPKLLKVTLVILSPTAPRCVSVLYREPKLLKAGWYVITQHYRDEVSVLYREPKLLKVLRLRNRLATARGFSALP